MIGPAGQILLGLAAATGAAAAAASVARPRFARPLAYAHAVLFAGALALLAGAFLAGRVEIAYVWEHTDARYPFWYQLAGVWGGQKGSVVLWGAFIAVCAALEARRASGAVPGLAVGAALAVSAALAAYTFLDEAFLATAPGALAARPLGRGLQEVLVTPFMVIHPPVQFAAYALVTLPAAYALAALALRAPAKEWAPRAMAWARPAWLAATVGLGLGGLWAYYVLSFGGFWAWDPVETANLLPWLALTAFLHAGKDRERHDDFPLAAPILAVAAFALVVFATFATRSGLWISVHAFTDPTGRFSPDAAARLVAILEAHAPTRFFLGVLAVTLALLAIALARAVGGGLAARAYAGAAAAVAAWAVAAPVSLVGLLFEVGARLPVGGAGTGAGLLVATAIAAPPLVAYLRPARPERFPPLSERGLMHAAVVIFGVAIAVTLVLDLMTVNGADRAVFDARAPFVALPLIAAITVRFAMELMTTRRALILGLGSLAVGVAGAFAFPGSRALAAAAPVLAAGLFATFASLARAAAVPGLPPRARAAGVLLLASGLAGIVLWANPPTDLHLGLARIETGVFHSLALFPAALAALVCGILVLRGAGRAAAWTGAALGILAWGYGVGAAAALAAGVLAPAGGAVPRARLAQAFSRAGIRLVHVGLVLGLAGYAAATYAVESTEVTESSAVGPGASVAIGDQVLLLGAPQATAGAGGGWLSAVEVPVSVLRDGEVVDRAVLVLYHKGDPISHYDPSLDIRRSYAGDLYLSVDSMRVNGTWIRAHGDACVAQPAGGAEGVCFRTADVDAVAFTVVRLPLVGLVWAGLWTLAAAMVMILVGRGLARTLTVRTSGTQSQPGREST